MLIASQFLAPKIHCFLSDKRFLSSAYFSFAGFLRFKQPSYIFKSYLLVELSNRRTLLLTQSVGAGQHPRVFSARLADCLFSPVRLKGPTVGLTSIPPTAFLCFCSLLLSCFLRILGTTELGHEVKLLRGPTKVREANVLSVFSFPRQGLKFNE